MPEETIFEILHNMDKFTNNLLVEWNKIFNEDLGVSHVLLLGHLYANGRSRSSDIAKQLGLKPPTVTHLTEKLVKKGFAVRLTDDSDRRIVYLAITDEGTKVLHRANEEGHRLRAKLFEKLSLEEQRQMLVIYEKLNN